MPSILKVFDPLSESWGWKKTTDSVKQKWREPSSGVRSWRKLGFQRGVKLNFMRGEEISIIGGWVRAPVAIINFASNPCENLRVYIGFNEELPDKKNAKLIIATGARTHPNY